jgi:hypothetical protein
VTIHKTISVSSDKFWEDCHKVARRENKALSTIIMEKLTEYVKVHGEGNPVYVLDKWVDNPDFKAVPAALESREKWVKFCQHCPDETLKEIEYAGMMLGIIARAYMKIDPKDRPEKFFTDLRSMERFYNNG